MNSLIAFSLAILLALAFVPAQQSQLKSQPKQVMECGTVVTSEQYEMEMARKAELAGRKVAPLAVVPPIDKPYYLPMTIHMVRDSEGINFGISPEDLAEVIQNLNDLWRPFGIQFFIYGEVDFSIQNDAFFNLPNVLSQQEALRRVNSVPNTINVYFSNLQGIAGQATFTKSSTQGILVDYIAMSRFGAGFFGREVFAHEMGHFFDLYHTHENWSDSSGKPTRVECPSGSNCSTAGDLLCDTPADPGLFNPIRVDNNCAYNNSATLPAGCDATPYAPLTNNLMSLAKNPCRNQFTPGQISKVLSVLKSAGNRKNLINGKTRYVDLLASSSNTKCTYEAPCRTMSQAVQIANNGDSIYTKSGTYWAPSFGTKELRLSKWGLDPSTGVILVP